MFKSVRFFPHSFQYLLLVNILIMAILTGMMWYPIVELPELINKFNKVSGYKTDVKKFVVCTSNEMSEKEILKSSFKIISKK